MSVYKVIFGLFVMFVLSACTTSSSFVEPVQNLKWDNKRICVVNNNDLTMAIQGLVNRTIVDNGLISIPIPDATVAKEFDCNFYVIYGGKMNWDLGHYLSEFRMTAYDGKHTRVGHVEVKSSDGLSLNKWTSGEKLVKKAIAEMFHQSESSPL